ncbi:MAG: hypothetical protein LBC87_08540 [Fibromonadaceae bacterium]|jgi:hypothetical protein|nr:hypothetical protein [Fibromonadaceae bacterium]
MKISRLFILTASLLLAIAFIFSCSSSDEEKNSTKYCYNERDCTRIGGCPYMSSESDCTGEGGIVVNLSQCEEFDVHIYNCY